MNICIYDGQYIYYNTADLISCFKFCLYLLRESISHGYPFFYVKRVTSMFFTLYHLNTLVLAARLTKQQYLKFLLKHTKSDQAVRFVAGTIFMHSYIVLILYYYQIQQFVYKNFVLKNCLFIISAIKEFIFKIGKSQVAENLFSKKMNRDLLESHHF